MNAIRSLHIQGFRSLRDVTLEFGRVNVLIGANGSGKSNLLSFLRLLPLLRTRSLQKFVANLGGANAVLYRGGKVTPALAIDVEFSSEKLQTHYDARLIRTQADQFVFLHEKISGPLTPDAKWLLLGTDHVESRVEEVATGKNSTTEARNVHWWLSRINFYHFHDTSSASPLRMPAKANDTRYLRSDGSNLAPYLLRLKQSQEDADRAAWTLLIGLIRQIAPYIKELIPTPINADPDSFRVDDPAAQADRVSIRLDWIDENDDMYGVHQFSDGTLRAIALFAALTQPSAQLPAFISIDEPELGLHPAALAIFVEIVRSISSRCQVLLATQSPALLDYFAPEEVLVAERIESATQIRRLDPEALSGWLEDYALSELFDKNVLGGRP